MATARRKLIEVALPLEAEKRIGHLYPKNDRLGYDIESRIPDSGYLRHLKDCGDEGCPISELQQVLPAQNRDYLKRLLSELRLEGHVRLDGQRRGAKWHAKKDR